MIRTKLHFRYAEATKIKQRENSTDDYFYTSENFPIYGTLKLSTITVFVHTTYLDSSLAEAAGEQLSLQLLRLQLPLGHLDLLVLVNDLLVVVGIVPVPPVPLGVPQEGELRLDVLVWADVLAGELCTHLPGTLRGGGEGVT